MIEPTIYLLASRYRRTLYIGVTSNLAARMTQHRERTGSGFAGAYDVTRLVHVERFPTMIEAIAREKALKKWWRAWKIDLVEVGNPEWDDLFPLINA